MCVEQKLCKSRPSRGVWGHAPQKTFEKIAACPEIESGGFWQLHVADYPTPVFKITAF